MKILNFKLFNESIVTRDDLYPKDEIEHKDMIEPALLTFKEYFSKLQEGPGKKWHEDNVYNYSLDDNIRTIDINDKKWKRLKRIKVYKIIIDFYKKFYYLNIIVFIFSMSILLIIILHFIHLFQ